MIELPVLFIVGTLGLAVEVAYIIHMMKKAANWTPRRLPLE